jgi:hypothetical protein
MQNSPASHGDKLHALLKNRKLPQEDYPRVQQAIARYKKWRQQLETAAGAPYEILAAQVSFLNDYKFYIDVNLVFDSKKNFLYRQKGQLKLDNTIIEEFLPVLVNSIFADKLQHNPGISVGPATCFSGVRFESTLLTELPDGGMRIKAKNQDFAISKKLFLRASHQPEFQEFVTQETHIAYVAAECKTNLDKTMFQEGAATASDLKTAIPGAKYYLLCDWLDMTPVSASTTAIDEIIILRKAKRLSSNIRRHFNTVEGRQQNKALFVDYLRANPFSVETFSRFTEHIHRLISDDAEDDILRRGYF